MEEPYWQDQLANQPGSQTARHVVSHDWQGHLKGIPSDPLETTGIHLNLLRKSMKHIGFPLISVWWAEKHSLSF